MISVPRASRVARARSHKASTSLSTGAYPRVGDHAILLGALGSSRAASHDASGRGSACRSVGSGLTTTSSAVTTSDIRRAIGALVERPGHPGASEPPNGTRPSDGLTPERPQHDEGMRTEPPPSEPVASGIIPAAIAAAVPPEDPPALWSKFHGLKVDPNSVLVVSAFHPNSG